MHTFYRLLVILTATSVGSLLTTQVNAAWTLDNNSSRLSFVSIKAGNIAEVHRFKHLQGTISDAGLGTVSIDTTSVDTQIPIRDERMQTHLFESENYPAASVNIQVSPETLAALSTAETISQAVSGKLTIRDLHVEFQAEILVSQNTSGSLLVVASQPVLLNAANVGFAHGVEKLREIAGLPSISLAVPVTFALVFEKD